jgi:L-fucose isomerase-like protein
MPLQFRKIRIGFVNLILDFLQGQDVAVRYSSEAQQHLRSRLNAEVVEFPEPVAKREQAARAWKLFKAQDVDAVILFNGTFNTGELTAEIIRNLECPFALWGIGELALASRNFTGSMVGVMAAGALFKNFDKPFSFIYGPVSDPQAQRRLGTFTAAVRAIAYLREATIGVLGMRPDGFQIAGFDELAVKQVFGTELTKISMYEFTNTIRAVEEKDVDRDMEIQ